MMIFSLVALIGLEKCCITSGYVTYVSEPWPVGLLFDIVFVFGVKYKIKILFPLSNLKGCIDFIRSLQNGIPLQHRGQV